LAKIGPPPIAIVGEIAGHRNGGAGKGFGDVKAVFMI
jgi:hypothetical protein